jgi:hypothetical protein
VLGAVIFEHRGWLPRDLGGLYEEAYHEIEYAVGATRATLLPEEYGRAPAVYAEELDSELERVGLTGSQLELKRSGWVRALARFEAAPVRSLLLRALRWANIILGSLAGVVGASEALKEFKESVEQGLEDET